MRYRDAGNVHTDFHLAMNTSIRYVLQNYGADFLRELFRRTAQRVYADIYNALKRGDTAPLREHWEYYYAREGGRFEITAADDGFVFHVLDCPAVRHLGEKEIPVTEEFSLQDSLLNEAWSEGTPFRIDTDLISPGNYKFTVARR